jgi:uncharacterized protein YkwD
VGIENLAVSPADANLVFAAGSDQVYRSADGGQTWSEVSFEAYLGSAIPAFDSKPPHALYLGHYNGLYRSLDGGQAWEDSGLDQEVAVMWVSPSDSEILCGANSNWLRLSAGDTAWQASPWEAPSSSWEGIVATQSGQVLYAWGDAGLWRYSAGQQSGGYTVHLPAALRNYGRSPDPVRQAVERINDYRAIAGVPPVERQTTIVQAAQNHANYYLQNLNDSSAWSYGVHGEVADKPGYTGQWPTDRVRATGYTHFGGASEVMHYLGNPTASVDSWIAGVYHRVILLDAEARHAGYGYGQAAVDVVNLGFEPGDSGVWSPITPYPLVYPADEQTGVPTGWGGLENPDPLPPGASTPVGYPVTLQGINGTLTVTWAELQTASGQVVTVHPNPSHCQEYNCFALIAVAPLNADTTYTTHAQGTVDGVAFDRTWSFTTGGVSVAAAAVHENMPLDPPWRK